MENEKIQRFKTYQNAEFGDTEKLVCLDTGKVILHGDCYHDRIAELIEGFFYGLDYAKIKYIWLYFFFKILENFLNFKSSM